MLGGLVVSVATVLVIGRAAAAAAAGGAADFAALGTGFVGVDLAVGEFWGVLGNT